MLVWNPYIMKLIDYESGEINKARLYIKEHGKKISVSRMEKCQKRLDFLIEQRKVLNKAFAVQQALSGLIFDPDKAFEIVIAYKSHCESKLFEGQQDLFKKSEAVVLESTIGRRLIDSLDIFDEEYDYEDLTAFYRNMQELLLKNLDYVLEEHAVAHEQKRNWTFYGEDGTLTPFDEDSQPEKA